LSDAPGKVDFEQFLTDYFAECDEHLDVSRRSLLALESSIGHHEPDHQILDELFRSFHSIKGLSAMVSVSQAETLAHVLESYLGELRRGNLALSVRGLEALISGVKLLEQILTARRGNATPPDSSAALAALNELLLAERRVKSETQEPMLTAGQALAQADAPLLDRLKPGQAAWQFTFTPSPALAAQAINVGSVRTRLQQLGDILQAAPAVQPGGQISFRFILATDKPAEELKESLPQGVSFERYLAPANDEAVADPQPTFEPVRPRLSLAAASVVRVDLARLDDLMQKVGELVLCRARLEESIRRLRDSTPPAEWRALQETNLAMERQLRDLREGVMRVRMVPFREVFARMQFVVRDLAGEFNKQVSLQLSGEETEIDKFVVERMMDPLLHLVRNAVCHGLETPQERAAAGKPPTGQIALRARATGETVTLEVEDDGRGIDAGQIRTRAQATGVLKGERLNDAAGLLDVLCTPGFSIREQADRASGRGVGMDVVRRAVEDLNGTLSLHTAPGKQTKFTIELPLTLSIADALIVTVLGEKYAIPQAAVREVLQVAATAIRVLEHNEIIPYRNGVLPLLRLSSFFGGETRREGDFKVLVLGDGVHAVGLTIDRILGLREIVVRPVTDTLIQVEGISGATELGDGKVVLILDATGLTRSARRQERSVPKKSADNPHEVSRSTGGARKGA
jgi:two-component system, chemotaxis family, sensor kinase CheA